MCIIFSHIHLMIYLDKLLMKILSIIAFLIITLPLASISKAEWYMGEIDTSDKPKHIKLKALDDSEQVFEYKGITCLISKTNFYRVSNDYISEFRTLQCQINKDISSLESITCNKGLILFTNMTLKIKGEFFSPKLTCDLRY